MASVWLAESNAIFIPFILYFCFQAPSVPTNLQIKSEPGCRKIYWDLPKDLNGNPGENANYVTIHYRKEVAALFSTKLATAVGYNCKEFFFLLQEVRFANAILNLDFSCIKLSSYTHPHITIHIIKEMTI